MTQLLHRGERGNPVTEAGDGETPTEQLMAGPAGLSLIAAPMAAVVRCLLRLSGRKHLKRSSRCGCGGVGTYHSLVAKMSKLALSQVDTTESSH